MQFLRAIIGLFVLVAVVIIMGKTHHHKSHAVTVYSWIGCSVVLLLIWGCL